MVTGQFLGILLENLGIPSPRNRDSGRRVSGWQWSIELLAVLALFLVQSGRYLWLDW